MSGVSAGDNGLKQELRQARVTQMKISTKR